MNLRKLAPAPVQVGGRHLALRIGELTAERRPLPDFLVIGAQRSGTTSLFRALMAHPRIERANLHKGVNYFDIHYDRGERWYRAHFPMRQDDDGVRVFDASGYYMFHPLAAERIVGDMPQVKVIAMVRAPEERAFSAFKHELARGFEWERDFGRALDLEQSRLAGEVERMRADPSYYSFNHRHHGYQARGEYARLLEPFVTGLGRERVLVVESERFFSEPESCYRDIVEFLDVPGFTPASFERYNARPSADMDPGLRSRLVSHFESHDEALAALLGRDPVWRRKGVTA